MWSAAKELYGRKIVVLKFNGMEDIMKAQAVTDVGQQRKVNQDYLYYTIDKIGNLPNLFLVADGMGGHKAGDMASKYTVESFVRLVSETIQKDPILILSDNVKTVNTLLINKAAESEDYKGMGTTLVAATLQDNVLRIANVGDSRLYIISNDIRQITRDHSYVEEMVMRGQIDRKQARTHAKKNIITRAIGAEKTVEPEMFSIDIQKGDKILMCTDGLSNMIEDTDILKIVKESTDIDEAVKRLVATAYENGGTDNISVLMVEI